MRLSMLLDLVAYSDWIIEKSSMGRKPHREPWGYTGDYMQQYADPADLPEVVRLFTHEGQSSEQEAARWLLKHDKLVP